MKMLLLSLSCCVLAFVAWPAGSAQRQIWFTMPNYVGAGQDDWNKLFGRPDAPWPEFMNHVQVLAATGIAKIPDEILSNAFTKLSEHHVSFAIDNLAQSWVNEPECGHRVESYTDPPGNRKVVNKIQSDGGRLLYIAMDEPLWFGHYYNGHDACHSDIANVAERAAAIMREFTKVFPNVAIGDIEPIPALTSQPNWQRDYKAWLSAFNTAMGQPVAFVHIDINWSKPGWQESLQRFANFVRSERLPIGIIYNGNTHADSEMTGDKWLNSAKQNYTEIETKLGIIPDQVIFHSWVKFPTHAISDKATNELGLDHLVDQYVKKRLN
jgi:hypothetical protein